MGLSTVPSNDSYDGPTRYSSRRSGAADSKPWDSEDEELNRTNPAADARDHQVAVSSPSAVRTTPRGDPFDFTGVEADFQTATTGRGMRGSSGSTRTHAPSAPPVGRSRLSTTGGGGICQALALFDFPGVEVSSHRARPR
jgi:hypothetical protein